MNHHWGTRLFHLWFLLIDHLDLELWSQPKAFPYSTCDRLEYWQCYLRDKGPHLSIRSSQHSIWANWLAHFGYLLSIECPPFVFHQSHSLRATILPMQSLYLYSYCYLQSWRPTLVHQLQSLAAELISISKHSKRFLDGTAHSNLLVVVKATFGLHAEPIWEAHWLSCLQ